jgi:hypothetical protein
MPQLICDVSAVFGPFGKHHLQRYAEELKEREEVELQMESPDKKGGSPNKNSRKARLNLNSLLQNRWKAPIKKEGRQIRIVRIG